MTWQHGLIGRRRALHHSPSPLTCRDARRLPAPLRRTSARASRKAHLAAQFQRTSLCVELRVIAAPWQQQRLAIPTIPISGPRAVAAARACARCIRRLHAWLGASSTHPRARVGALSQLSREPAPRFSHHSPSPPRALAAGHGAQRARLAVAHRPVHRSAGTVFLIWIY